MWRVLVAVGNGLESDRLVELLASSETFKPWGVQDDRQAYERLTPEVAVLVIDTSLAKGKIEELIRYGRSKAPWLQVVALAGAADAAFAFQLGRAGVSAYLEQPASDDAIWTAVREAFERATGPLKKAGVRTLVDEKVGHLNMVGTTPLMRGVYAAIDRLADTPGSLLITGETGAGKESVARALHLRSRRVAEPFIAVNVAALPESLLESELFGHEKGAFTNAIMQRRGRFELADRGTLLLDEIGDLSLTAQAKILRAIETKTFQRVGGMEDFHTDARILFSTNRDLEEAVRSKTFREDLYYRLVGIEIHLPPLRERRDDLPLLADYFLQALAQQTGVQPRGVSPEAMEVFNGYYWPGNVREYFRTLEAAAAVAAQDQIRVADLPSRVRAAGSRGDRPADAPPPLREVETAAILRAVEFSQGNRAEAARTLGIPVGELIARARALGLELSDRT